MKSREIKSKCIILTSITLFLISIGLYAGNELSFERFSTTSINTQNMALASIANKTGAVEKNSKLIEVKKEDKQNKTEEKVEVKNISKEEQQEEKVEQFPVRVWYLPTEQGRITTYPQYGHVAYDITSSRGTGEVIYPVANGVISSIYRDYYGALIVTVRHIVDGKYYSSQYVHLSRYADIYVGQEVTPFTPIGWMGSSGWSTGNHLHITVADCNMFGNNDECSNLNGFFSYIKRRYSEGFHGLGDLIEVPYEWYSR